MLNPNYRYIGIDFETTGLDIQKDVPIQIGIVEISPDGEIIDSFESLIKPQKDIKELKNIVQFITKIETAQLVFAPEIEEIASQISHFFDEKTIIIGHNISFDVAFLEKVIPDVRYYSAFDTFQLAQALVPYPPSYALEVLVQHLEDKPLFLAWKSKFGLTFSHGVYEGGEASFHDAFYDAKSTLALFCYLISYIQQIAEKYPVLKHYMKRSETVVNEIVVYPSSSSASCEVSREDEMHRGRGLPPLKKIAPAATSLASFPYHIDVNELKDAERYYVGNLDFKALLTSLLFNKKIILVFSTKPKLDIAKNILFEMGVKNIGFAREEQTISTEKFQQFLNKASFNSFELYFILKYCSHLFLGYGVLDLNSKGDYMVYNLIKDERQVVKYPVVLTTHHGLYTILEKEAHVYADFDIIFFDVEWRYRNYNAYLSRTCDLYYIQNFVDMLVYKYRDSRLEIQDSRLETQDSRLEILDSRGETGDSRGETQVPCLESRVSNLGELGELGELESSPLQQFDTFFTMFLGILWTDTKKLFFGRAEDELQINPIVNHPSFYQTNLLLPKLRAFKEPLQSILSEQDFQTLRKQIEHFLEICETVAKVQRKMYGQTGSDFYFLFSEEAKFTNWEEFKEVFQRNHIIFLSHYEKNYTPLFTSLPTQVQDTGKIPPHRKLPYVNTIGALEKQLQKGAQSVFVISTVKEESRGIFEALQKMHFLADYELLAENITGGAGKNIYKANKKAAKIVLGGYHFLMMCFAQKVVFDEILVWNVRGAQSQLILEDVVWYEPRRESKS